MISHVCIIANSTGLQPIASGDRGSDVKLLQQVERVLSRPAAGRWQALPTRSPGFILRHIRGADGRITAVRESQVVEDRSGLCVIQLTYGRLPRQLSTLSLHVRSHTRA